MPEKGSNNIIASASRLASKRMDTKPYKDVSLPYGQSIKIFSRLKTMTFVGKTVFYSLTKGFVRFFVCLTTDVHWQL